MAGERIRLNVRSRERLGSGESRRLRKAGLIPGVIYGQGSEPRAFAVPERELRRVLTGDHGLHAILDVTVDGDGGSRSSVVKDYQTDPVRGTIAHVDLQEVRLDEPIQATVVVELVGDPEGVTMGGVLTQVTRELTVEALPMEIPDRIEADVSGLAIGDSLRLSEIPALRGVTFVDDPEETVLASVTQPTRVEVPEEMVEQTEDAAEGVPQGDEASQKASEQAAGPDADAAGAPGTTSG